MRTIYEPRGAAKEYGDYALNIYTGCPHACFYCYCPNVLHKDRETFHKDVKVREGVITATEQFLFHTGFTGNTVHLCFTCDPYPTGYDSTATRRIIKLLKDYGNHVQILTKGSGRRDFDLLDRNDWYGVTLDGSETEECLTQRLHDLCDAYAKGIKTWVSFEPVVNAENVLREIVMAQKCGVGKVKIGKLNYHPSSINWKTFGEEAEQLCKNLDLPYYIKESLRKEMGE